MFDIALLKSGPSNGKRNEWLEVSYALFIEWFCPFLLEKKPQISLEHDDAF